MCISPLEFYTSSSNWHTTFPLNDERQKVANSFGIIDKDNPFVNYLVRPLSLNSQNFTIEMFVPSIGS
jgi:hypothetical protein